MNFKSFLNLFKVKEALKERLIDSGEDFTAVFLVKVTTRFHLHIIPEISQSIEWEDQSYILCFVYDDIFELADSLHSNQLIHDLDLIFDIFEEIFLSDLFDTHVLQTLCLAILDIFAEAGNTNHA